MSELDLRNLTIRFVHLEVGGLFEMEQSCDDVGWHDFNPGIVLLHDIVVELACVSDFLFQRFQLTLQIHEIRIGLQLRIVFGYNLQIHERAAQLVFRGDALRHVTALRGLHHAGTGLRDLREHLGFVGRITFDRFHQIRNKIGTLLELHIDLRQPFFTRLRSVTSPL